MGDAVALDAEALDTLRATIYIGLCPLGCAERG